ncbi:tetratricopeptide repeat protein [Sphingosinicella sp. BN140058]|uniref:tetratricopeptide repeat protein n=1 Tax=Sphingosinicella sp. BN140058 TaxID=1892855 RepID=UPI001012B97E|nr:tetratricopeptide repeat protein [Sphingosinicella sp. BN140058]QAY75466.1 tetratricopeptide repeat protein [Sphingosinicella sp. BN140058]
MNRVLHHASFGATLALMIAALPVRASDHGSVSKAPDCSESLIGTPLAVPSYSPDTQRRLDQDIAIAKAALEIAPDREDTHIWYGRRLDYAGRICDAVHAFSDGLKRFPNSYKLYRFRARDLTRARRFEDALLDYERALALMGDTPDSFEPDGIPNPLGLTISTYRGNIVYYHAQTSFATGDYETVVAGMSKSVEFAADFARDDMRVPAAYWTYLALRKMGQHDKARAAIAAIEPDLKLIENFTYHQAVQIMQGRLDPTVLSGNPDSTLKFAIAMEKRFAGDEAGAKALLTEIVRENPQGHWPAEAELARPDRAPS